MKPKIYLSKSKAGNFDDIVKVKTLLGKYDCEILEFQGGIYSTDKLLASEILILIPPKTDYYYPNSFFVGKGQYTEINLFCNKYPLHPVFIYNINNETNKFYLLKDYYDDNLDEGLQENWQDHWGNVIGDKLLDEEDFVKYLNLSSKQVTPDQSTIITKTKENEEISIIINKNISLLICC